MEHIVKILSIEQAALRVKRFVIEKPFGFSFVPGHSIMVSLPESKNDKHPFSFTSTNDLPYLEFHIKCYSGRGSITEKIHNLNVGDYLVLSDMFGSFRYTKPGVFIAGGQGITPFLAVFRQLNKDGKIEKNLLIHSVRTKDDLIREQELKSILGKNYTVVLTQKKEDGGYNGRVTSEFLLSVISDFSQPFYVCGPDAFVADMKRIVTSLKSKHSQQ